MTTHDTADAQQLREAAEIERNAALGWRGLEEEQLGDWLLRAGNGFTGRANSTLPLGDPGRALPEALDAVADWYRDRGLRPLVQVPLPLCAVVDEALDRHGWRAFNHTQVLVGDVADVLEATSLRPDLPAPTISARPSAAWLSAYHYRGAGLPEGAYEVLVRARDPVFVSIETSSDVLAVGRGAVDEGWLGVTAVTVDAAHRRRGLATQVMRALANWGRARGAAQLYLQVASDNTAALSMYAGLGLRRHHDYHYRTLD